MDDLITRLTAAIDGLAALAQRVKDVYVYPEDHEHAGESYWPTPRVERVFNDYSLGHAIGLDLVKACGPEAVLRGCVADRRILERHREKVYRVKGGGPPTEADQPDCLWCENQYWPCPDLRDLAERYGIEP